MIDFRRRARNALLGLALGDAIGWPAMFHRGQLLPPWTRRIRRQMDAEREETNILRIPMPFSLNRPPDSFDLSPTDDTEWAAWTISHLLKHQCKIGPDWIEKSWLPLARGNERVLGWVSTRTAITNIRKGLLPPESGSDNPHYFDDGALCRAVPIGIAYAGRPDEASRAAAADACVTNSEDGIWVAQSLAVALSLACTGDPGFIGAAVDSLPKDSWSRRTVEHAFELCSRDLPVLALVPSLYPILNREYSDGCVGPETLALSLAIVSKTGGRFDAAVTIASSFAKGADAVPAIVGAIAGAMAEGDPIPSDWKRSLKTLKGISLPSLAGSDYVMLVDQFVNDCLPPQETNK